VSKLAAFRRGRPFAAKILGEGVATAGEYVVVSTKLDTFCYMTVQTAPLDSKMCLVL